MSFLKFKQVFYTKELETCFHESGNSFHQCFLVQKKTNFLLVQGKAASIAGHQPGDGADGVGG